MRPSLATRSSVRLLPILVALATACLTACGSSDGGTCNQGPPIGFTTAVPLGTVGEKGADAALAADENGDPMLAYLWLNADGSPTGSTLSFTRWDRCAGAFTSPKQIDVVGSIDSAAPGRRVALAYDAAAKKLVVGYEMVVPASGGFNDRKTIVIQTSTDKGVTWAGKLQVAEQKPGDIEDAFGPAVAIGGGTIHVAYSESNRDCCPDAEPNCGGCNGAWYLAGDGTTFQRQLIKDAGGVAQPYQSAVISLALDGAGKPALAFHVEPLKGYNATLEFWRPDGNPAVVVMDSASQQNDDPSVSLAFDGLKPRVAAHLIADASPTYDLRFSASADGVTWSAPVKLPRDGSDFTQWYQALSIDSRGAAAVAAYINGGQGDAKCGGPRLLRSTDLASWSVCGADANKQYKGIGGKFVQSYFAPGDKLSIAFEGSLGGDGSGSGVIFWRE